MFHGGGELIVMTNSWEGIDGIQLISFFGRESLSYDGGKRGNRPVMIDAPLKDVLQCLGDKEKNYENVTQAIRDVKWKVRKKNDGV